MNSQLLLDGRQQLGSVSGKQSWGEQTMGRSQLRTVVRLKPQRGDSGTRKASQGKGLGSLVGLEQRKCGVPREQRPPGGAQPVVLTQHSWGQSPALQPPWGLPAESGLMRVHASEAGTTPSSWPHRKLPEDVRRTGATGTQTFWTRNPGWMSTLWNLHNGELIQAEWSTLRLEAGDADPPPQHPDPRPRALRFALKIQEPGELTEESASAGTRGGLMETLPLCPQWRQLPALLPTVSHAGPSSGRLQGTPLPLWLCALPVLTPAPSCCCIWGHLPNTPFAPVSSSLGLASGEAHTRAGSWQLRVKPKDTATGTLGKKQD